jgi:DNA-binding protein HU-beta
MSWRAKEVLGMNKTELIEEVARRTGMSKAGAQRTVDVLFSTAPREGIIANAVANGDRVQITGFGTFERRRRKKRTGRNPQTGDEMIIPGGMYPAFSAGKSLKDRVGK